MFARYGKLSAHLGIAAAVVLLIVGALLTGCAQASNASDESASIKLPPFAHASVPRVSFERGADSNTVLQLSTPVTIDEQRSNPTFCTGMFVLTDCSGQPMKAEFGWRVIEADSEEPKPIEVSFLLTDEELATASGVRFAVVCLGERMALPARGIAIRSFEEEKQVYSIAEEKRRWEEHCAEWRARYSLENFSDTVCIGDSIMQNATASLQAALPGVTVNADAGRTLEEGGLVFEDKSPDCGVLDHVRRDGGRYARYVIHTGNNDATGMTLANAEEIVQRLGSDKQIYFVTMMVRGNWDGTATTNAAIDEVVARYPNVHKIDWYGLVSGREGDYLSDGVHPWRSREPDYAAFIKEGLSVIY